MYIYLVLLIFYLIASIIEEKEITTLKYRKWICFILILPLFILVAFRDNTVGIDTIVYYEAFNSIGSYSSIFQAINGPSHMEPGYTILTYAMYKWGFSYYGLQFFEAVIIYYSFGRLIYKYSPNMSMSCFLFFALQRVFSTMNQTRMWLAAALLFFAIHFIKERKFFSFLAVIILASLFHQSAFVFFITYLIVLLPESRKKEFFLLGASTIIMFIGTPFFSWLTNKLGVYDNYVTESQFSGAINSSVMLSLAISAICFIWALVQRLYTYNYGEKFGEFNAPIRLKSVKIKLKGIKKENKNKISLGKVLYNLLLLTCCFNIIGMRSEILGRVTAYFSVFLVIAVPLLLNIICSKPIKWISYLLVAILFFVYFLLYLFLRTEWFGVVPYKFL